MFAYFRDVVMSSADQSSQSQHSHGSEDILFNAAVFAEKELFKGSLGRYLIGLHPQNPMPSIFDSSVAQAAPINIFNLRGVGVPILSDFIGKAGMQDVDIGSSNYHPSSTPFHGGDHQQEHEDRGHIGGGH